MPCSGQPPVSLPLVVIPPLHPPAAASGTPEMRALSEGELALGLDELAREGGRMIDTVQA